jgi:hypothetical protein
MSRLSRIGRDGAREDDDVALLGTDPRDLSSGLADRGRHEGRCGRLPAVEPRYRGSPVAARRLAPVWQTPPIE